MDERETTMFTQAIKLARADQTACDIVRGIVALRQAKQHPGRSAIAAFQDRCLEIGATVPNEGYWAPLFWAVACHVKG
jgi:hypothetical protein